MNNKSFVSVCLLCFVFRDESFHTIIILFTRLERLGSLDDAKGSETLSVQSYGGIDIVCYG